MARPVKKNADYFLHPNNLRSDRRVKALRASYGLKGYAVYIMILEALTAADHFRFEYNVLEIELLAGDFDYDAKQLTEIIVYLIRMNMLAVDNSNRLYSASLEEALSNLLEYRKRQRVKQRKHREGESSSAIHSEKPTQSDQLSIVPSNNPLYSNNNPVVTALNEVTDGNNAVLPSDNSNVPSNIEVFPSNNDVVTMNNPIRGDKVSIEEKREASKEKRVKEIPPDQNDRKVIISQNAEIGSTGQKEKSSAQKEKGRQAVAFNSCKDVFLRHAQGYYFEGKDAKALKQILAKISATLDREGAGGGLVPSFTLFIENLPKYWRTKKFTLPLLNSNYNEIINEILTKNGPKTEPDTNTKFGRHKTDELAQRASEFGR